METSKKGMDLVKRYEGLRLKAYRCPAGILTIGYGHTSAAGEPKVLEGMAITAATAESILAKDLEQFEKAVLESSKHNLTQCQFDALVSFAFNCGTGALKTLCRNRSLEQIARAIPLYNKAGGVPLAGLTKRRNEEVALFWSDEKSTSEKPDNKPQEKTITGSKTIGAGAAVVAAGAGTLDTLHQANEAIKQASEVKGQLTEIAGTLATQNWLIGGLALIVICGASFMIWERYKKIRQEGV